MLILMVLTITFAETRMKQFYGVGSSEKALKCSSNSNSNSNCDSTSIVSNEKSGNGSNSGICDRHNYYSGDPIFKAILLVKYTAENIVADRLQLRNEMDTSNYSAMTAPNTSPI